MLREILEKNASGMYLESVNVQDEKFRTLYEILGGYNLMVNIPSLKAFQNMAKHSGLTPNEIKSWYNIVVLGKNENYLRDIVEKIDCNFKEWLKEYNRILKKNGYVMVKNDNELVSVDEYEYEDGVLTLFGMDSHDNDKEINWCNGGWEFDA